MTGNQTTVPTARVQAAIAWAAKWLTAKPIVPLHGGLALDTCLNAEGVSTLTVTAYNENVTARTVVDLDGSLADNEEAHRWIVSGRLLAGLAATLDARKQSTLEADGVELVLTNGRARMTLPMLDATDYPALPPLAPRVATIGGDALAAAVRRVGVAVAGEEKAGAVYLAMHVSVTAGEIRFMGTDKNRVAGQSVRITDATPAETTPNGLMFTEAATSFAGPGDVVLGIGDSGLSLSNQTRSITMRVGGYEWPVEIMVKALGLTLPHSVILDRNDLTEPVKRAVLVGEKSAPVQIGIKPGLVTIAARRGAESKGGADDEIEAVGDGPELTTGFNPEYLSEALASAPGDKVRISYSDNPHRPVVLASDDEPTWRHTLMPVRLR